MTKSVIQQVATTEKQPAPNAAAQSQKQPSEQKWQSTFSKRLPNRIGTALSSDTGGCSSA